MYQIKKNKQCFLGLLTVLTISLLMSACSSGDSGGSSAGTGSSSVEGTITSISMAMLQPATSKEYSLANFLKSLIFVKSAYAATPVEDVHVAIGQMGTTTNASGYFRIDGVPPGTHEMVFSKSNQVSKMTVTVGENDMVSMHNISMRGSQAYARDISHRPMEGFNSNGTPGTPPN